MGQTRCGKSTLASACLGEYHRLYPAHYIFIVDLKGKGRYLPMERRRVGEPLFPDGVMARPIHGRLAVPVVAELMEKKAHFPREDACMVVQSLEGTNTLCRWLYNNSRIDRPCIVFFDETIDIMRGDFRAIEPVRKIIQHGGELGIGTVVVNQTPTYVDRTWFTEATQLYVGRLIAWEHRERIIDHTTVAGAWAYLEEPLPKHDFLYIDQENERMARVRLGVAA